MVQVNCLFTLMQSQHLYNHKWSYQILSLFVVDPSNPFYVHARKHRNWPSCGATAYAAGGFSLSNARIILCNCRGEFSWTRELLHLALSCLQFSAQIHTRPFLFWKIFQILLEHIIQDVLPGVAYVSFNVWQLHASKIDGGERLIVLNMSDCTKHVSSFLIHPIFIYIHNIQPWSTWLVNFDTVMCSFSHDIMWIVLAGTDARFNAGAVGS